MLGTESEFSSWVNQALEMANSGLPCSSAIFWLKLSTSRVVMPRRERSARRRSPGGWGLMNRMVQQSRLAQRAFGERYGSLCSIGPKCVVVGKAVWLDMIFASLDARTGEPRFLAGKIKVLLAGANGSIESVRKCGRGAGRLR